MMSKVFSMNLSYKEKMDTLQNEFKISVSREISEEVLSVCNLSTGVFRKGYDSGISAGEMRKARETAYELQDMGLAAEKIAKAVKVSTDTLQKWFAERGGMPVK